MPTTLTDPIDIQSSAPPVEVSLDRAGVRGVERTVRFADGLAVIATIDVTVGLGATQRGVHMSRFHEAASEAIDDACTSGTPDVAALAARIAAGAAARQGGAVAEATVTCRLPYRTHTPATGLPTEEHVDVTGSAAVDECGISATLGVRVTGINACPCAQELVRRGAEDELAAAGFSSDQLDAIFAAVPVATHNQRAQAELHITTATQLDVETLVEICRASMSAPIDELLKRPDELHVVAHAHRHPKFVEDSVREMLARASTLPLSSGDLVRARQVNFESIHSHDAWAESSLTV
jgi:MptA/FolE2 family GTP cyclohydrolase